jgi:hypothetical protein
MKTTLNGLVILLALLLSFSCNQQQNSKEEKQEEEVKNISAQDILGNPDYQAISTVDTGKNQEISNPPLSRSRKI